MVTVKTLLEQLRATSAADARARELRLLRLHA